MAIKSRFDDVAKFVDTEHGFISREIFVDPTFTRRSSTRSSPGPGCSSAMKA